jgi:uncharacterized protein involved in response to NO
MSLSCVVVIIGEILLAFGAICYCLVLLALRNPQSRDKWWTKRWMIESVHITVIMGSWVVGIGFLIRGLAKLDTAKELGLHAVGFLAVLGCMVLAIKNMHIKQRLSEFTLMQSGRATVTAMPLVTNSTSEPDSPVQKAA